MRQRKHGYCCLSPKELEIIRTRRLNDENVTLESLGETLGISKERVRQIETRAMQKLRSALLAINDAALIISKVRKTDVRQKSV